MNKSINIKLTEDEAFHIVRILEFGKAEPRIVWNDKKNREEEKLDNEDKKFNKFLERLQGKINKAYNESQI